MTPLTAWLPIKTRSPNGSHRSWRTVWRYKRAARAGARQVCPQHPLPVVVRLVRFSAGVLDDDNLQGALKPVRDGCSDRLGVPDNDPRIRFEYGQARCKRGEYGVRIEVRPMEEG